MTASPVPLRVAIGEDNADLAEMLSMLFELQPDMSCVGHAPTLTRLLALVDATHPDAIVIDLQLADGSALPLLRKLRTERPDCLLIAFSGDGNPLLEPACRAAGCDALVRKDGRPMAVIDSLRRLRATLRADAPSARP